MPRVAEIPQSPQTHRYNDGILTVKLRKPGEPELRMEMDPDHQIFTHHKLLIEPTPTASEEVFNILKALFEKANPDLKLEPSDLDVLAIAKYVEHQLKLLEANIQFEPGVTWRDLGPYGVCIMIDQNSGSVFVNVNEQRYIRHTDMSEQEMCESLAYMRKPFYRSGEVEPDTVGRLRKIIEKNVERHPRDQTEHWLKVNTPYKDGEIRTVEHQRIRTADGSMTGFCL